MKWAIFIAVNLWALVLFGTLNAAKPQDPLTGRYMLFEGEYSPTILLDTTSGATWRTVACDETEVVRSHAGCWDAMNFPTAYTPK